MAYISEIFLGDLFEDSFLLYGFDLKDSVLYKTRKEEIIQSYITFDELTRAATEKMLADNRGLFEKLLQGSIIYTDVNEKDDSLRLLHLN